MRTLHLLYHELRTQPSAYSYATDTDAFARQVGLFARLRRDPACTLRPEITFDDGHASDFDLALPVLQAHGLQALFFVTGGWTGERSGYMGWNELRALQQAGQIIGAHGWTHTLLTHCDEKQLQRELLHTRLVLEDKLGCSVSTMSLPGGRANRRVLAACKDAGYTRVYTSEPRPETEPFGFNVGRLNMRGDWTLDWIERLFTPESTTLTALARQHQVKATAKSLLGDRVYARLWALLNRQEPGQEAS